LIDLNPFSVFSNSTLEFYCPSYVEINTGTLISWENGDIVPHTVTFINTELKDSMDPAGTDIVEPHKSLNMIFTGRAGGFMGKFVKLIKVRGENTLL
jgi:plastocyanin